ncbi:hypothetical protein CEP53_000303 [Fusarium sp. AF-6]|nr:hypothetical protein CEP53_000303 [Fusarium sp. AF-6]
MAIVGFFVYTDKHPKFQLKKGTPTAIEEIWEGWGKVTCSNFSTWSHCKVPMDNGSLFDVYATHILYSFMWSMAGTLEDPLSGKTDCRRNATSDSNEQGTTLWNSHLARLAKAFARVSVRSEQETLLEIIWSLSVAGKLPRPPDLFTSMSKKVTHGYRSGELKYFDMATMEALNLIQAHADNTSGISERAAAWLLELFHSMKDRVEQSYGLRPTKLRGWYKSLRSRKKTAIRINMEPDFLGHLTMLYSRQGREMDDDFYQSTDEELPAHLEATLLATDGGVPPEQCDFDQQRV